MGRKGLTACDCGQLSPAAGKVRMGCEMEERLKERRRIAGPSLWTLHA